MTAVSDVIETLKAAMVPGQPVYHGTMPQPVGTEPAPLPGVVVQRIGSEWPATFCGTDAEFALATVQIDFYARSAELAQMAASQARGAVAAMPSRPTLSNEFSLYESGIRAWRVVQTWLAPDYSPSL